MRGRQMRKPRACVLCTGNIGVFIWMKERVEVFCELDGEERKMEKKGRCQWLTERN
jgi:hypothetical protein